MSSGSPVAKSFIAEGSICRARRATLLSGTTAETVAVLIVAPINVPGAQELKNKPLRKACPNEDRNFGMLTECLRTLPSLDNFKLPLLCDEQYVVKPGLAYTELKRKHRTERYIRYNFVVPYANSTLNDTHYINPDKFQELCLHLVQAVNHLHKRGIAHRDIKPGNIHCYNDHPPRLADYTHATLMPQEGDTTRNKFGTMWFTAPELSDKNNKASTRNMLAKADCFSLGATLFYVLSHNSNLIESGLLKYNTYGSVEPTPLRSLEDTKEEKYNQDRTILKYNLERIEDKITASTLEVIKGLAEPNPALRMTLDDAEALLQQAAEAVSPPEPTRLRT
jgi:serine/threonine protein kinase